MNELEDDWGSLKAALPPPAKSSPSLHDRHHQSNERRAGGQAKWLIVLVVSLVVLYIVLALASKSIDTESHVAEQKYIPNSPHSMGGTAGVALNAQGEMSTIEALSSKTDTTGSSRKKKISSDCKNIWTGDSLVGRCFGLSVHFKYSELKHIEVVETPDECKTLCCELGGNLAL